MIFPILIVAGILLAAGCGGRVTHRSDQPELADGDVPGKPIPDGKPWDVTPPGDTFEIHFIDVGQGSATLISNNVDEAVLVDCGPYEARARVSGLIEDLGITSIGKVILTHPHADHYGGCSHVATRFDVGEFLYTDYPNNNDGYQGTLNSFPDKRVIRDGDGLDFGNLHFAFYHPPAQFLVGASPENNNSLVMVVCNKSEACLFIGGDIEEGGRNSLLSRYGESELGKVDLFQVPHHGSRSGTGEDLLDATTPESAFISVGAGNPYGHPHQETLDLLAGYGIPVYATAWNGTITVHVDEGNYNNIATERD